jgi:hypothetical protein
MSHPYKTTGHLILAAIAALGLLAVEAAAGSELRLTIANDPIAGNRRGDDLYTAALDVEIGSPLGRWSFGERMFTDRAAGRRFDETYLELARPLPEVRGWQPEAALGVLRVGEGLFGQNVQNELHEAIGSDLLDLAYPDDARWHATVGLAATRSFDLAGARWAQLRVEAVEMVDFRRWVRVGLLADRELAPDLVVRVGLGGRIDEARSPLLGDHLEDRGLTAELGVRYRQLELRYAFNDFGTGTGHLSLAVHLGRAREASRGGR